jgi:Leucine-rich repeat (LRR) protein
MVALVTINISYASTFSPSTRAPIDITENEISNDKDPKSLFDDPKFQEIMAKKKKINTEIPIKTTEAPKQETSTASESHAPDDTTLLEDVAHSEIGKDHYDDINYDQYYDDEEFDDDDDEMDDEEDDDDDELADLPKVHVQKNNDKQKMNATIEPEDDIIDDTEDYEEEEGDEDEEEETEVDSPKVVEDKKQCPRDCICERNMHAYLVATCSRLDLGTQSFTPAITDLQVIDIGPKYPIVLGADFFKKIGLKNVKSIKIANSTVEYISPNAFNGLDSLYSVNLTNIGIDMIHPDTFANNTKLKILTLAGNNLNAMQSESSPYTSYMLKSQSVEELDISNCNMGSLLPTAFNELKNIVYINLSGNKLEKLPSSLFNKVETIEELDLSNNKLSSLPKLIFNKTSLAILHLKHNDFTGSLEFVTKDVQKLDLSYNKIANINGQMFKHMEGMINLILKGNGIKRIHQNAFIGMKNLRHIDLSFNDLDQISSMTFFKNSFLDVIRLNNNGRLKSLPNEGFESAQGSFNTYNLDISNCDISELNENTFRTMPQLTRLYMNWNNIASIGKNLFSPLVKLKELDISNNLFQTLDPETFWNNQDLDKLNIAGNPLESLSTKVFEPLIYLKELDVSDCDLTQLWHDSSSEDRTGNLLKNLKYLNVSNNDIRNLYVSDISTMVNLKIFDLKNNPLQCNDDFRNLMKFLGERKVSFGNRNLNSENAELRNNYFIGEISPFIEWNDLARKICKRNEENKLHNAEVLDEINEDEDNDEYDDEEEDEYYDENTEPIRESVTKKPVQEITKKPSVQSAEKTTESDVVDSNNVIITEDGEYDYEEDDEDEDDIEDEDEEEDMEDERIPEDKEILDPEKTKILIDGVNVIRNFENRLLGGIKQDTGDIPRIWIMLLIVMIAMVLMLAIVAQIVYLCMRKRGERYRQALLQSKNSIIYQKLSEEIAPQTPKFHRYIPIQQV